MSTSSVDEQVFEELRPPLARRDALLEADRCPIEEWLRPQARFAHLLRPENAQIVDEIQRQVTVDWKALMARCEEGVPA